MKKITLSKKQTAWIVLGVIALIVLISFSILIYRQVQILKINKVIGIDVSAYQGEIDWKEIEKQGISFAYIKATEGEDYQDEKFDANWKNIEKTDIRKGAYLFYNFDEDPSEQANYFIETVGKDFGDLPPVIDVEWVSEKTADKKKMVANLQKMIEALTDYYNEDPIIYTNYKTYNDYLSGSFNDLSFWICDLDSESPTLSKNDWVFWQYTWRGVLNGTNGSTEFVDMNLYNGTLKEFNEQF